MKNPFVDWHVEGRTYSTRRLPGGCPHCYRETLVELPTPLLEKQTDGTTIVCLHTLGGCNTGFAVGE